ncbi:hypothetical protein L1887_30393 [Cichorium endivia]|nr:hypothetical protein L1887_30393 [Cichorium endivia]
MYDFGRHVDTKLVRFLTNSGQMAFVFYLLQSYPSFFYVRNIHPFHLAGEGNAQELRELGFSCKALEI